MSNHVTDVRTPVLSGLLLTGSTVVAAGIGFALTMLLNRSVGRWMLVPVSAAGLGIIAGGIARFTLERRGTLTRWLVAMTSLSMGLIVLNWFTVGLLGVHLAPGGLSSPDWLGLGQIGLGGFSAWLALVAWNESAQPQSTAGSDLAVVVPEIPAQQLRPRRLLTPPPSPVKVRQPSRWKLRQRKAAPVRIKMSSVLEHRCPYCLELVDEADPRGVQVCSICGAWHHADCWAVTGTCQVPHHHDL